LATLRSVVFCLFLSLLPTVVLAQNSEQPQSLSDDIKDKSLEELLEVDVVPINILGTHTHLEGE